MSRKAIIFPGVGYHKDKPLLYYGRKLAQELGYETIELTYTGFEKKIRGDQGKMKRAFEQALKQSREALSQHTFLKEDDLLIISKSVGTVAAAAWQAEMGLSAKNIYFTPVEATFFFAVKESGIVFHGTDDPWVTNEIVEDNCRRLHLPLYLTEGANHSLETGDVEKDLRTMQVTMQQCRTWLLENGCLRAEND